VIKLLLLVALGFVPAFFVIKASYNYAGVCTEGQRFWRWHRPSDEELIANLKAHATSNSGVKSDYSVPPIWTVPGDEYQPASIVDRISGRASRLVHYHNPWLNDVKYLHSSGYFYSPNCVGGWVPPA
jgi:hypothetical protein